MKFIDPHHDLWHLAEGEDGPLVNPPARDHSLLTLEQWHAVRAHWLVGLNVGVLVPNDTDIDVLRDDLPRLSLVALNFPKWTDGRAYSQARVLRTRLRFAGEVRAKGEVLVDMLPLLQRTGFDAVQLRADQRLDAAQRALRFFAGHYQGDTQEPRPAFARDLQADLVADEARRRREAESLAGDGI